MSLFDKLKYKLKEAKGSDAEFKSGSFDMAGTQDQLRKKNNGHTVCLTVV